MLAGRSANPLTLHHWFGTVDPRPLALFRIGFGLVLVQELVLRLPDFRAFLTDDGIWPRALNTHWYAWSVFNLVGSPAAVLAILALGFVFALSFLFGYRTRLATAGCWVVFVSLQNRNRDIALGGDYHASILLFWSLFADLGARFSVDARRKKQAPTEVPALGLRMLAYTPALIYLHAARFKLLLGGGGWLHGPAIYQTLMLDGSTRPLGAWLRQHPSLCSLLGDGVLAMEFLIPIALTLPVAIPAARAAAIAMNLAVQLGILLTMKVEIFTDIMIVASLLWVQPEWLDAFAVRTRGTAIGRVMDRFRDPAPSPAASPARGATQTMSRIVQGVAAALFVSHAALPAAWKKMPVALCDALEGLNLSLKVDLFSHGYTLETWEAPGTTKSQGAIADVVAVAAPGIHDGVSWRYTRWAALVGNRAAEAHAAPIADYLCRRYAEVTGEAPLRFQLIRVYGPPAVPGATPEAPARQSLIDKQCGMDGVVTRVER